MTDPISQQQFITAGGKSDPIYIEDVFVQDLYRGDGSTTTDVINHINLTGEGGLVIGKCSNQAHEWDFRDTVRGANKSLACNSTAAEVTTSWGFDFLNNGFNRGNRDNFNKNTEDYITTTFRKAKGFFDVVSYSGNGTAGRTIDHNLGCTPGMIWIKNRDATYNWAVYHKDIHTSAPQDYYIQLNDTGGAIDANTIWNDTAPTASQFTLGDSNTVNGSGNNYIAYVFAGADDAGSKIYGPDSDSDIIRCGTYTGNNSTNEIDIGWPADLIIVKNVDGSPSTNHWGWSDPLIMKGPFTSNWYGDGNSLKMSQSDAKTAFYRNPPSPKGFWIVGDGNYNQSGVKFIYMAIRQRGPKICKTAEDGNVGTNYFAMDVGNSESYVPPGCFDSGTSFPVQFALTKQPNSASDWTADNRNHWDKYWIPNQYTRNDNTFWLWTSSMGWAKNQNTSTLSYMWRNGPGFMTLTVRGNGAAATHTHNMGKAPEMVWVKNMDTDDNNIIGHKDLMPGGNSWKYHLRMSGTNAKINSTVHFNDTAPTATTVTLGADNSVAANEDQIQIVLFTSFEGICKCGGYTGDGTSDNSKTITLGFQPRFIYLKRADMTGDHLILDSYNGFGNWLKLNDSGTQTNVGLISVTSTGFTISSSNGDVNANTGEYVYYAHA